MAPCLSVSVHAMRRYLERVRGLALEGGDVEVVQAVERTDIPIDLRARLERGMTLGASAVLYGGMRWVIANRVLVTVHPLRTDRQRRRRRVRFEVD